MGDERPREYVPGMDRRNVASPTGLKPRGHTRRMARSEQRERTVLRTWGVRPRHWRAPRSPSDGTREWAWTRGGSGDTLSSEALAAAREPPEPSVSKRGCPGTLGRSNTLKTE